MLRLKACLIVSASDRMHEAVYAEFASGCEVVKQYQQCPLHHVISLGGVSVAFSASCLHEHEKGLFFSSMSLKQTHARLRESV